MSKKENRILKLFVYFLIFIVTFREIIAFYTSSFIKFIPDLLIWSMTIYILCKNKFKIKLRLYDLFFLIFILVGFLSTLINQSSFLAFLLQFRSIASLYAFFYCIRNIKFNNNDYKIVAREFVIIVLFLSFFSLIEFLTNKCLLFPNEWATAIIYKTNYDRVYSLLNNPNTFAMYLTLVVMLFSSFERKKIIKLPILIYVIIFVSILLSGSRSAFIAAIIIFIYLVVLIFFKRKFKDILKLFFIIAISFLLVVGFNSIKHTMNFSCKSNIRFSCTGDKCDSIKNEVDTPQIGETIPNEGNDKLSNGGKVDNLYAGNISKNDDFDDNHTNQGRKDKNNLLKKLNISIFDRWYETFSGKTTEDSSVNGRIYNVKLGLKIMVDNFLIGTGFGTFGGAGSRMVHSKIYDEYKIPNGFYSDNDYIKIMVETGIIGTLIYALFVLTFFQSQKNSFCQSVLLLIFFLMGMFYNITEMQVLCLVFYITFNLQDGSDVDE